MAGLYKIDAPSSLNQRGPLSRHTEGRYTQVRLLVNISPLLTFPRSPTEISLHGFISWVTIQFSLN